MHFNRQALDQLEDRFRARLINSLSGFKSANLIGTISDNGITNLSIVSSVFHIGANPPLVGMIIRPHSVTRDTLENIINTRQYTINQVSDRFWQQAHQCSARYDADISEFDAVGLTPEYVEGVLPPFVAESQLKYALDVREIQTLEINGTVLVIGEIGEIFVGEDAVAEDGYVDIEKIGTVAVSGLDSYHTTQRLGRLSYAKPGQEIKKID
ncbi:flavin reductase family protein [Enterovibrio paralichthyis]|uniref:flavin reductase family protein n=1 Tax=Enterovibrio paralichthyis TaxID=2853805 RepID=UPI001C483884|nr:flavin reductase family protein [Enterovibrio paralichthyis]MBV7296440.1 flavin reductase family protein [Enterovibrio paralichthyis]